MEARLRTLVPTAVFLGGCAPVAEDPDVVVEVSETMPTVARVRWSSEELIAGYARFGEYGNAWRSTPATEPTIDHEATLVGLPPDAEITVAVVVTYGFPTTVTFTTGGLPDAPATVLDPEPLGGIWVPYVLTSLSGKTENHVVLVDHHGRVTWDFTDRRGLGVPRVLARHDNRGIVYASAPLTGGPSPDAALVKVSWDGVVDEVIPVPNLAQDFVDEADGTLVALAYEVRDNVVGNQIVEVGPSGVPTQVWSVWDCFDPAVDGGGDPAVGWTRATALDAAANGWLVSLAGFDAIVRVDRASRTCSWAVGGPVGTFTVEGEPFVNPHQFELVDDWNAGQSLLVFDNAGAPGGSSRVIEYAFDASARMASMIGELVLDPPTAITTLGDVHRGEIRDDLPGNTLVVWSESRLVDQYDLAGERVWRTQLLGEGTVGYAQVLLEPSDVP